MQLINSPLFRCTSSKSLHCQQYSRSSIPPASQHFEASQSRNFFTIVRPEGCFQEWWGGCTVWPRRWVEHPQISEQTRRNSGLGADFGNGMRRSTFQWKKRFFREKGGGNSVNEGFGQDFHRKGDSVKRFGPFTEPPDSENWKVAVLIPFPRKSEIVDRPLCWPLCMQTPSKAPLTPP